VRRRFGAARDDRGVAAVEAGLVTTVLMPMLVGVLFFGNYFWHAQKVGAYDPRLPQDAVVGYQLTCQEVVDLVKQAVVDQSSTVGDAYTPGLSLDQVAAEVVDVLPDASVVVHISVRVQVADQFTSLLPDGGAVVNDATQRLENVTVSTATCS
jgi:hypothetical protein